MHWFFTFLFLNTTQIYTLKSGESVDKVLERAGIQKERKTEIVRALRSRMNLRRCRAGDKLCITNEEGRFVQLKYEGKQAIWTIDSLMRVLKLPETKRLMFLEGTIDKGSLWGALIGAGGTPHLLYEFADEVFPWDIDFNVETRNGDKFEILVNAKYIEDKFIGYGPIVFARYISKNKKFTGVYYSKGGYGYYNLFGKSLQRMFLRSPVSYVRISSGYTLRRFHPILRRWRPHQGIDYAAPIGTSVRTIGDGRVTFAGWRRGFGKQVIIKHGNGFKSYYAHLSRYAKGIRKGKYVKQGQLIGYVGSTGLSTGPHLDFRLSKHGKWLNPIKLNPPRSTPLKGDNLKEYKEYVNALLSTMEGLKTFEQLPPVF